MRRAPVALIACAALAGCGGSSPPASTPATTASTPATSTTGGLKPSTTPRFAAPPAGAPLQAATVQVAYRNIAIAPDALKVKVGTTIRWTNDDSVEHNVTSVPGSPQRFASKDFGEGGTYAVKLERPGVIHYMCTIHPTTMNGTIDVVR